MAKPLIKQTEIDMGWKDIVKETKKLNNKSVEIGLFGSGGAPDSNVAARGAVNEFGAHIKVTEKMRGFLAAAYGVFLKESTKFIDIPARPFTRTGFDNNKNKLQRAIKKWFNDLVSGSMSAAKLLNNVGVIHTDQLKKTLRRRKLWKPNSELTIKIKKKSAPLINTGEMMNSIKYKIGKGK